MVLSPGPIVSTAQLSTRQFGGRGDSRTSVCTDDVYNQNKCQNKLAYQPRSALSIFPFCAVITNSD